MCLLCNKIFQNIDEYLAKIALVFAEEHVGLHTNYPTFLSLST
jgi:hypothetical protein